MTTNQTPPAYDEKRIAEIEKRLAAFRSAKLHHTRMDWRASFMSAVSVYLTDTDHLVELVKEQHRKLSVTEKALRDADNVFCQCKYKEECNCYDKMQAITEQALSTLRS
jgi:hypothetical protein